MPYGHQSLQRLAVTFAFVGITTLSFAASAANRPPVISGTPGTTVAVGNTYSFTPVASDPDGDRLTFTVWNKPAWATFSTATGLLQGTPGAGDVGTYSEVYVGVTDTKINIWLPPFNLTVSAGGGNRPPTISGTPPTSVPQGTPYSFQPTASDPDGNPLTYTVWNKPAWATFTPATGRLQGTPGAGDVGTYSEVYVGVTDSKINVWLPPFNLTVSASGGNRPPAISGTPSTSVPQGTAYSFQPTASDPDGNPLTYTVWNKPAWATFSTATGRLQGTPGAGDVGTYSEVYVGVTDSKVNVWLSPFNLTVMASATGSATLSWQPPTQNTDGSALTNLAGYKVYWGTSQGVYPNSVTINNPGLASYVVGNLVRGTYFFAVSSLNTAGMESSRSNSSSKTIP